MHEVSRGRIIIGAYETMEEAHAILKNAPRGQVFGNSPVVFLTPPSAVGIHVVRTAQAAHEMYARCVTWPLHLSSADLWQLLLEEAQDLPEGYCYQVTRDILFVAADPVRANQLLSYFIERREVSPFELAGGKFTPLKRDPKTTPRRPATVVQA